ncbi:MAG: hypothetical protein ACTSP4_10660 [Candidatus Hodarchaeales archaeon]
MLKKLILANFRIFFQGIENTDYRTLEFFGKAVKRMASNTEAAISFLRGNGAIISGRLLLVNPEDTEDNF